MSDQETFRVLAGDTVVVGVVDESDVLVGLPGLAGPEGPQGIQGPQGIDGPAGPSGYADGATHPVHHGLLAWSYDPCLVSAQAAAGQGQMVMTRVNLPSDASVTGLALWMVAAGAGLTAGQCFAALYAADGTRLAVSADQSAAWQVGGMKLVPLVGGPLAVSAGAYYIGHYANGTTLPQWARVSSNTGLVNFNLPNTALRYAYAAGTHTTDPPSPVASMVGAASFWGALY